MVRPIYFHILCGLFSLALCVNLLVKSSSNNLPPVPWYCSNEYVKRVILQGLELYSNSVDQLQTYLEVS